MYKKFFKRLFDIIVGLLALPFCAIVWLIVGIFIFAEDRGSIFYKSSRVGKNQKVYTMYKLRSMKVGAEDIRNLDGSTYNGKNDLRVTRVGKFIRKTSIDETPQIINVLKGDMSLIGPRPATPMILENMTEIQSFRFLVRPGLTGYTQMMYRNSAQGQKRYESDKYYVDNVSFVLDVKILFGTIVKVLKKSDIYNNTNDSSESEVSDGGKEYETQR